MLLYYQAGEGILYQNMGCLIMAGLWAGARIISFLSTDRSRTIRIGAIVFVVIGLVGAALFGMIITHMRVGLLSSALLLFFTGAAVAGSLLLVHFLGILPTAAALVGVSLAAVVLIRA